jgi:hypothetical protein
LRYGLHRNQLYDWRRAFGTAVGNAIAEAGAQGPEFIPVATDAGSGSAAIEIEIGGSIGAYQGGDRSGFAGQGASLLKAMK